jgi:hypothetical protein
LKYYALLQTLLLKQPHYSGRLLWSKDRWPAQEIFGDTIWTHWKGQKWAALFTKKTLIKHNDENATLAAVLIIPAGAVEVSFKYVNELMISINLSTFAIFICSKIWFLRKDGCGSHDWTEINASTTIEWKKLAN